MLHSCSIKTRAQRVWITSSLSSAVLLNLRVSLISLDFSTVDSLVLLDAHSSSCQRCCFSNPARPSLFQPAPRSGPYMAGPSGRGAARFKYTLRLQECQTPPTNLPESDAPWRHNNGHVCSISISVFCKSKMKSHLWSLLKDTEKARRARDGRLSRRVCSTVSTRSADNTIILVLSCICSLSYDQLVASVVTQAVKRLQSKLRKRHVAHFLCGRT